MNTLNNNILLSIVLPIYNEEKTIPLLMQRLQKITENFPPNTIEILFINDGSKDNSLALLKTALKTNFHYQIIDFSRNFGHQIAVTCGLKQAQGKAVVVMDADLQDPPELIQLMCDKWKNGAQIVIAHRKKREGETLFKKFTAWLFYRLLALMSDVPIILDAGDFYLLDRKVIDAINACPEHAKFLRGLVAWAGFKKELIEYERQSRQYGKTNYTLKKMIGLAKDALFGFSSKPIFFIHCLTAFSLSVAFLVVVSTFIAAFLPGVTVPGWASIVILISFFSGMILLAIGILGEYVYRIFRDTQSRPLYLIQEIIKSD